MFEVIREQGFIPMDIRQREISMTMYGAVDQNQGSLIAHGAMDTTVPILRV